MVKLHQVTPGSSVDITEISTSGKDFHEDRDQAEREFSQFQLEISELQTKLYAEGRQRLLIILQAMDGGGKDGTTRSVFKEVNPQGMKIVSFKEPSKEELAHDFLWRIHKEVPGNGMIGLFNRSHYEDVLVVRVDKLVPKNIWEERYELINNFEKHLVNTGTHVLKFFLHISFKDQRKTFQERLQDPAKHWKFNISDIEKRKQWPEYMQAYSDAISRCSTTHAPWYIIPSDQNWYRNWAVANVIAATLREMNPQFPPLPPEYASLKVE
ncbi:polyphosphate kinase 2 family protein [Planctomicrobium sp. SH668]|uniref:polyphosphate kinase 2 family protein n=1 Tax=Planctomicrobium sp. SH668 TaxID=3448126 RepID=UPI003F5AE706